MGKRKNGRMMKVLSVALCLCLMLSCAPISVFAVAADYVDDAIGEISAGIFAEKSESITIDETKVNADNTVDSAAVPCENDGCSGTYENGICSLDGTHYQSATLNADGVYEIANAGNLYWFAAKVNGGENTISGELTADITVNKNVLKENGELNGDGSNFKAWTLIGNSDFEYKGKFDGKNHTVSGLYFNDPNAKRVALFAYTYGAELKNIGVVDSFFRGAERTAVVVAHARHRTVVENCFSKSTVKSNTSCGGVIGFLQYDSVAKKCYNFGSVEITCENSYGGVSAGGVVGATYSSTIENSYNLGVLKKSDTNTNSYIGGVVGTADKTNVKNCYNVGTIVGSENIGAVIGDNKSNSTVTDCYYQKGVADKGTGSAGSDVAGQTTVKTAEQFASGEVTSLLNGGVTDGTQIWYQTCGEGLPSFSGKTVYDNGSYGYSNYQTPAVENGIFQIANADNLMWFAEYVNSGNKNANAVLTADIDMTGYAWVTIGSTDLYYSNTYSSGNYADKGYSGTFDGNYHKISNLSVTSEADVSATYGLFGTLSGTVKNLGMTKFKYTHKAVDMRVGAVVGQIIGGSVLNCYVLDSTINPGTNIAGGIAGCNYGGLIESCYVYGCNVSAGRSGYIVADNRADAAGDRVGTVKNCYSNGAIVGIYTGNEVNSGTKTSHRFENGEVTYLLNGGNPDGVWKLSNGLPAFVGEKMYRNTCEGDVFYSSTSGNFDSHDLGDDFICKNCGEYDMPEIKDGVYQITNVSQLYAYGHDGAGKDAVLLNDLKIGTKENPYLDWKAINIDNHGVFDGQGHTIELYATYSNVGGEMDGTPVGLFGGNYVTIQNFTLKGSLVCNTNGRVGGVNPDGYAVKFYNIISYLDIENQGTGYTGGIVGEFGQNAVNGAVINNCAVYADVSGKTYVGGLVGAGWNGNQYWKITNSMYCGKLSGRDGVTGALVGYSKTDANSSKVVIDNCYYINKYASVGGSDRVLGTNNSTAVTKHDFVRGAVAYLINGGVTDGTQTWYQTLDGKEYPVLDGETVYRVTATGCTSDGYGYTNSSDILSMNVSHSENSADYDNGICKICGAYEPCAGLGTESAAYKIKNAGNLYWFAEQVNSGKTGICGELTKDITVNENVLKEDGSLNGDSADFKAWVPIGASYSFAFEGKFDGKNYTVSGLYYNYSREYYVGFIGYGRASTIQNLGIVDSYFAGDSYVGGIAGFVGNQTVVSNCYNKGTLCGAYDIGGIVGHINDSGTIAECYNSGKILGGRGAGGIVGYAYGGLIRDCYNIGSVSGSAIIGGVLGCSEKKSRTTVKNCYNTGSVSGLEYVGGILGFYESGFSTINNCYYLKGCAKNGDDVVYNGIGAETVSPEDVGGQTDVKTLEQFERGEVTYRLNSGVTDGTQAWYQTIGTDKTPAFSGGTVYRINVTGCTTVEYAYSNDKDAPTIDVKHTADTADYNENGFCKNCGAYQPCEGSGTEETPYKIANEGNLYWFAAKVNGGETDICGELTADITVNKNVLKEDGSLNGNGSKFKAWTPIGSSDKQYSGKIDGKNHTVSGLYYNDSESNHIGFVGYICGATIQNLGIVDSYFAGNNYIGGIAGSIYKGGTVSNCYNKTTVRGEHNVGGIVGYIEAMQPNPANIIIEKCYNTGKISCEENGAGGIVGVDYRGTIRDCYNTGTVSGSEYVGGLLGVSKLGAVIRNCYYLTGSASKDIGYKIGNVSKTESKTAEQFASGEVTYLLNGGVTDGTQAWYQTLGTDNLPVFSGGSVYKVLTTGCVYGDARYENEGPDREEHTLHSESTADYENGFCKKCGAYQPCEGKGNFNNKYEISNAGNLYWFAEKVNNGETDICGKLTTAITVNENVLTEDGELNGDGSNFRTWTPIGNPENKYSGQFDGAYYGIYGLYLNSPEEDYVGLFGYIGNAANVNLAQMYDSYFSGRNYVGAVAGYGSDSVQLRYCRVEKAMVSGIENIGGIVGGWNKNSNVSNCVTTEGKIIGLNNVGGIVGYSNNSSTVNCSSDNSNIIKGSENIGGIVGYNCYGAIVADSTSLANVGSEGLSQNVGGVVGYNYFNSEIKDCRNSGEVIGLNNIGGVVGKLCYNSSVSSSASYSNAEGSDSVGGIAGYSYYSSTIENCYNIGSVTGSNYVGGIVGFNNYNSVVENSYCSGMIVGLNYTGGVIGKNSTGASAKNCYYKEHSAVNDNNYYEYYNGIGDKTGSLEDVAGQVEMKTREQFSSGEVAYLLQSNVKSEDIIDGGNVVGTYTPLVWGQRSNEIGSFPELVRDDSQRVIPVKNGDAIVNYSIYHRGDINDDGVVDVTDYQSAVNMALSDVTSSSENYNARTDFNFDGVIDVLDCAYFERLLSGNYVEIKN